MFQPILISTISLLGCTALFGQATNHLAPGAPGMDSHWPSAAKNGFGTSNTLRSKVWFTLNNGVMTEVYYPTLDVPNVQSLQLIIVTPEGKVETESEDTTHSITVSEGTGSATPLAWSMAQFIRLAVNLQVGHNSETPAVVTARYAKR